MLTCKEIARAIAADELSDAGWRKRFSYRVHLFMCRHCRRYERQIRSIGASARALFRGKVTDRSARDQLRASILDRIPGDGKTEAETQT